MTHELKQIFEAAQQAIQKGLKTVLVTVVGLDGSSYRKPGVRMLIAEDETMTGAVSGGCVEKETLRVAKQVFQHGIPEIMTYDGRYRLGCEGQLYILVEPFNPSNDMIRAFDEVIKSRQNFTIQSYYLNQVGRHSKMGSVFHLNGGQFKVNITSDQPDATLIFEQEMLPGQKLIIFGIEHDSGHLCQMASLCGWEVEIVNPTIRPSKISDFPGAARLLDMPLLEISQLHIDQYTAVVLMSHNFAKDLSCLIGLRKRRPSYIGILGSHKRFDQLLEALYENDPLIDQEFIELLHGPAGLNFGAITPQEIALSIISEIIAVDRNKTKTTALNIDKTKSEK